MTNRADADIFAKTLLSDADMQRIVSCAAPLPAGKLHEYLYCREVVVISSIRSATAAAAAARITQLETENATHLARIAELESQLATEVERLDFVLGKYAYCAEFSGDGYQLIVADEEVDCIAISGEDVNHPTPRAAIDAAIEFSKGGK